MPKININEYLLNKYGRRLSDDYILSEAEYNEIVSDLMRNGIYEITSKLAMNESDSIETVLDKYQVLLDSPIDTQHVNFTSFLNRTNYYYENCYARPKRVFMNVVDSTAFRYDSSTYGRTRGLDYVLSELISQDNNLGYKVTYHFYTPNANHTITPYNTDIITSDAQYSSYDYNNRLFTTTFNAVQNIKYMFLQDCQYTVDIDYCGADFIDLEKDAYGLQSQNLNDAIGELINIEDITDLSIYDRQTNTFRVQRYLDKYISLNNTTSEYSIVCNDFNCINFSNDDHKIFDIQNCEFLVLSNIEADAINLSNVNNAILINCNIGDIQIDRKSNVSILNSELNNLLNTVIDDSVVKFYNCKFIRNTSDSSPILQATNSIVDIDNCNFNITGLSDNPFNLVNDEVNFYNTTLLFNHTPGNNTLDDSVINYDGFNCLICSSDNQEIYNQLWEVL